MGYPSFGYRNPRNPLNHCYIAHTGIPKTFWEQEWVILIFVGDFGQDPSVCSHLGYALAICHICPANYNANFEIF